MQQVPFTNDLGIHGIHGMHEIPRSPHQFRKHLPFSLVFVTNLDTNFSKCTENDVFNCLLVFISPIVFTLETSGSNPIPIPVGIGVEAAGDGDALGARKELTSLYPGDYAVTTTLFCVFS